MPVPRRRWRFLLIAWLAVGATAGTIIAAEEPARILGLVSDKAGQPVPDARVWLTTRAEGEAYIGTALSESTADAEGRFVIEVTEAIRDAVASERGLALWADKAGLRPASQGATLDRLIGLDTRLTMEPEVPLELQVIDPEGRPAANVRVTVEAVGGDANVPPGAVSERRTATTVADGRARLAACSPDSYLRLILDSPQYGRQRTGVYDRARPRAFQARLAPVVRVEGRLTAPDPAAARNVALVVSSSSGDAHLATENSMSTQIVTDAEGRFVAPQALAGKVWIRLAEPRALEPWVLVRREISTKEEEAGGTVQISLVRGIPVRGAVLDSVTRQPVADVAVSIQPNGSTTHTLARTDAKGRYQALAAPGTYNFRATRTPRSYRNPDLSSVGTIEIPDNPAGLDLGPFEIEPARTVTGRVIAEDGRLVAGAQVLAYWQESGLRIYRSPALRAWTDREGRFRIERVPRGDAHDVYVAAFRADLASPEPRPLGLDDIVVLRVGSEHVAPLDLRVEDAQGRGIPGALVNIAMLPGPEGMVRIVNLFAERPDGQAPLTTRAYGGLDVPVTLPRWMRYSASVDQPGFRPHSTQWLPAPLPDQPSPPTRITLERLRTLAGRVVDRQGQPIAGARIAWIGERSVRPCPTTNPDGRFTLVDQIDETSSLVLLHSDFRARLVSVAAGPVTDLNITLGRLTEPPLRRLATRPESLTAEQARAWADEILEPLIRVARDPETPEDARASALQYLASTRPAQALAILYEVPIATASQADEVRRSVAVALSRTDPRAAITAAESITDASLRISARLRLFDRLATTDPDRAGSLLVPAALDTRDIPALPQRALAELRIVNRWLALDDRLKASALLGRAGPQALALATGPPPNTSLLQEYALAESRINLTAALDRVAQLPETERDDAHGRIAYALAASDPRNAEQMLGRIPRKPNPFGQLPEFRVCHRMAAVDLPRAQRIATRLPARSDQIHALGLIAQALAPTNPTAARKVLDQAFALLDPDFDELAQELQGMARRPCFQAGLIHLPLVEQIDPDRLDDRLALCMAVRRPRGLVVPFDFTAARQAILLARYDADLARAHAPPADVVLRELRQPTTTVPSLGISQPVVACYALLDQETTREMLAALPALDANLNYEVANIRILAARLVEMPWDQREGQILSEEFGLWIPGATGP